ncbi:hypothetical protein [Mucilaginibacter lacusdianchii]|uniref:hypothetical protein n=1 Tax=Mucilaginibacter lacusdianchii TaxID=2684211 RepID=UPI00131C7C72|nr:hypothetical protein [Mucilaginibacter sp. JXJ CY 39]
MDNINNFNEKLIKSIKADSSDLRGDLDKLDKELEKLLAKQKQLQESGKDSGKVYQTLASKIRVAQQTLEAESEQLDLNTKALKLNNGSLEQNEAFLESLTNQYNRVAQAKGNDAEEAKKLNNLIGNLSSTIEGQKAKLEESRKVFDFHKGSVDALKGSFNDIKENAGEFAPELKSVANGFNVMKDGLSVIKTGFQGVGGAIKATGFGLLVMVLQSVVEYFTQTTDGTKKLKQILAGLKVVVDTVKNGFSSMGRLIIGAFDHPVESLKKLGKMIEENIINRVKGFAVIYEGIVNLDFKKVANGVLQLGTGVKNVYTKAVEAFHEAGKEENKTDNQSHIIHQKRTIRHQEHKKQLKEVVDLTKQAEDERLASIARMAKMTLDGYAKEIADADAHFTEMKSKYTKFLDDYSKMSANQKATHQKEYMAVNKAVEQLELEHQVTLSSITKKFQDEDIKKLDEYHKQLNQIGKSARQLAQTQLDEDYQKQAEDVGKIQKDNQQVAYDIDSKIIDLNEQKRNTTNKVQLASIDKQLAELDKKRKEAQAIADDAQQVFKQISDKHTADTKDNKQKFDREDEDKAENKLQEGINQSREGGHESAALKKELALLNMQHDFAVKAAKERGEATTKIDQDYAKKKAEIEDKLATSKIHAGDKYIDAVLKNTKKDSAIYKAAFMAKKATSIADVIMSTKKSIMESLSAYSGIPFIGQALGIAQAAFMAAQGATSIAEIVKQKPGFAQGGQYISDGRGALLPGYSRTDNTNAYLRSGEAVVVSEAMRNPWARNLVSAINVAHGGRDFSIPNLSRGYAIGGIFTDGGNANRYYSQPVNDQKDLANTLAYQMINNFPPIYVDVKDVNNQQNILAQTVNRVNL